MRCESGMYGRWAGGVVLDLRDPFYGSRKKSFRFGKKFHVVILVQDF